MTAKTYMIKDMFPTLQGEGARSGSKAVFICFAGCNLWNGKPADRAKGVGHCARWCDASFVGGQPFTTSRLLAHLDALWLPGKPGVHDHWCVLTGGEPLLQVDVELLRALRSRVWRVAIETNGTINPSKDVIDLVDWVTVSPKLGADLAYDQRVDELKVVLPGAVGRERGWTDKHLLYLAKRFFTAKARYVQPQDPIDTITTGVSFLVPSMRRRPLRHGFSAKYDANLRRCITFVLENPNWQLGLQMHKAADLP